MKKKYKPKLFPMPQLGQELKEKLKLRWVWGGEKDGYCRVRDWPNGVGDPKPTDWIFPRGDLVWAAEDRESQESEKKKYSRVYDFFRGQTGWVLTKDIIDNRPLTKLAKELEGPQDTPIEKRLDEKSCTNGACAVQNWLRAKSMKHVREIGSAEKLRKDGDNAQKYIKYYKNSKNERIIDPNKAPVWPGDLIIFRNPEKAKFGKKYLNVGVLKDPKDKKIAPINKIGWSGHTATIAKLNVDNTGKITHLELIEAHMSGGGETKATKYSIDDIHYWGVGHWGFVATTTRSKELNHWNNVWKEWWYYHYHVSSFLKQLPIMSEEERNKWWYYRELKKTQDINQMLKKADKEKKLAADLLAEECKKRGRATITIEKAGGIKTYTSFLDVHGLAYWVEPKSPS